MKWLTENGSILSGVIALLVIVGNEVFGFTLTEDMIYQLLIALGLLSAPQIASKFKS